MIDDVLAEQFGKDIFFNRNKFAGLFKNIRFIMAQPEQLGQRRHRMDRSSGAQINLMSAELVF
ncbi:hypothetical protein D1872_226440 [compost metagenome]